MPHTGKGKKPYKSRPGHMQPKKGSKGSKGK